VTPVGFDWGKAVQNTIKITLTPDGILPDNVTSPKFTVSKYQISYVKEGSNNWSEYKDITCSINSNNKCNNGQFDISKLESGVYKLKFRFIDTKNNISLETNNEAYKIIVKPLTCPIITANKEKEKWTNQTVTLNLQHNDSYTSWEWYTNNSTGGWENWGINKTETSKDLIAEGERQGKIVIKNSAGETKECLTNIYYIDKTAPICTKVAKKIDSNGKDYTNKTWINENVYTSATCSDSLSRCRSNNVKSVTTKGKTNNVTDQFESSWTVKAEGKSTVTWSVYDAAGNKGTCSVIEPYIDKTPPIIYYRYIKDACFKSSANNNISSTMIYLVVDPKTKANDVSGVNLYASKHCYKDLSQSLIQSCKYQKLEARDWAIRTVSPSFKEEVEGHYNFWTEKEIVYFIMKATDNAGNEVISSLINPIEFTTSNNCTVDQWNSRSYDDVIKDAKQAGFYPVTISNYGSYIK
ncbi:MAG: hypothetical protein GX861_04250, partial [Tenericutes bacterium]|nr:hypothetical protein [Mycoplasmatota bacterium]